MTDPRDLVLSLEIASLPSIYRRITEVVEHPHSTAEDIAKVVSEDPGLTARLLGLVNSGFFGLPSPVDTVSRAITVVGTEQLCDLALATSVVRSFEGVPIDLVDMRSFWRHSLACGVGARLLALARQERNAERFLVGGLLHDLGALVLYAKLPRKARRALERSRREGLPLHAVERELFGFDHAELGWHLLRTWNLPPALQQMVLLHHEPPPDPPYPVDAGTVHVADVLAHALELGTAGEPRIPPLAPAALERVGLAPARLPGLLDEMLRSFGEAESLILGGTA